MSTWPNYYQIKSTETAMGVKINAQTEDSKYVKTVGKYCDWKNEMIIYSFSFKWGDNIYFKYYRSGKLAAKMNFSPWQFFPKWMYRFFSLEGREWNQLTTFLNDFGKQVLLSLLRFLKSRFKSISYIKLRLFKKGRKKWKQKIWLVMKLILPQD